MQQIKIFWTFIITILLQTELSMQQKSYDYNHGLADFTDMGTYSHSVQGNAHQNVEGLGTTTPHYSYCDCGVKQSPEDSAQLVENARSLNYLKRVVSSLLHQMNVRGHTFGPQEAITIDLQAEILYEDYMTLNEFLRSKKDDYEKYLVRVDDIVGSLLRPSEASLTCSIYESFQERFVNSLNLLFSLRSVFILLVTTSFFLIISIIFWKLWRSSTLSDFLKFSIILLFFVGCAWEFYAHIENAKAKNSARLDQTPDKPRDCYYDDLNLWERAVYFGKWLLSSDEDRCVQYYADRTVDPIWSISPAKALAETIGNLSAGFTKAFTSVFPGWFRPFFTLFLTVLGMLFVFLGVFKFTIRTPFVSIEPARAPVEVPPRLSRSVSVENLPQLEQPASQKQIAEKGATEVVHVKTRDIAVDTSDFDEYLRLLREQKDNESEQSIPELAESPAQSSNAFLLWLSGPSRLAQIVYAMYRFVVNCFDYLLRRTPCMMVSRVINNGPDEGW